MPHLQSSSTCPPVHVDDLPSEILREIFIATFPPKMFEPCSSLNSRETISPPRCLSHVSRRWRREALSYGELWSYLFLTDREIARNCQNSLELFLTFLERTNNLPINFRLLIGRAGPLAQKPQLVAERMLSILLEQQRRWRIVGIIWYGEISPDFQRLQVSDIPFVKSLTLSTRMFSPDGKDNFKCHPVHIDISRSPQIESLNVLGDYRLELGRLPIYELLEKCQLEPHSAAEASYTEGAKLCLKILDLAPNLHCMKFIKGPEEEDADIGLPRLHQLKELYLRHGYASMEVIENLHVPELEKLEYVWHTDICQGPTLLSMIERSHPPLTCLRVSHIPDDDTMLEILRLLPTLVKLSIDTCYDATGLLRGLEVRNRTGGGHVGPDEDDAVLCPRLRYLWLHMAMRYPEEEPDTEAPYALHSMLASRTEVMGTLNKVFLETNRFRLDKHPEISLDSWDHDLIEELFDFGGYVLIETGED